MELEVYVCLVRHGGFKINDKLWTSVDLKIWRFEKSGNLQIKKDDLKIKNLPFFSINYRIVVLLFVKHVFCLLIYWPLVFLNFMYSYLFWWFYHFEKGAKTWNKMWNGFMKSINNICYSNVSKYKILSSFQETKSNLHSKILYNFFGKQQFFKCMRIWKKFFREIFRFLQFKITLWSKSAIVKNKISPRSWRNFYQTHKNLLIQMLVAEIQPLKV